jgi:hypothetical protein
LPFGGCHLSLRRLTIAGLSSRSWTAPIKKHEHSMGLGERISLFFKRRKG